MYEPVTTLDTLDFLCHSKDPITLLYLQNPRLLLGANILFFLILSCVQAMHPFSLSDAGWLFEPSVHPYLVNFSMAFTSDCEFPCPVTVGNMLDR